MARFMTQTVLTSTSTGTIVLLVAMALLEILGNIPVRRARARDAYQYAYVIPSRFLFEIKTTKRYKKKNCHHKCIYNW